MTRPIALSLAAGLLSSLLFLTLAEGMAAGILLSYLAPLPLMMVGLSLGWTATLVAGLAGAAAVTAVAGGISALPFAVAAMVPGLVVVRQALLWRASADGGGEWYPPGQVLAWLTATGAALILIGAALIPEHPANGDMGGIEAWMAETIGQAIDLLVSALPAEQRRTATQWWTPLFPAMVTGSWLVMAVVNAVTAQGFLARLGRSRRPSPAYGQLWLPTWLGIMLAIAAAMAGLFEGDLGYLGRNVAMLLVVPFAFQGLAVIHCWVAGRANARSFLVAFYGVLFLVLAWAFLPLAGLGLVRFVTRFLRERESGGGKEK